MVNRSSKTRPTFEFSQHGTRVYCELKMQRFIIFRVGQALLAILVVSGIVFSLSHLSGDPLTTIMPMGDVEPEDIEALRVKWGAGQIATRSIRGIPEERRTGGLRRIRCLRRPDRHGNGFDAIPRHSATFKCGAAAHHWHRPANGRNNSGKERWILDYKGKSIAFLGQAVPNFCLGIGLMWFFAV